MVIKSAKRYLPGASAILLLILLGIYDPDLVWPGVEIYAAVTYVCIYLVVSNTKAKQAGYFHRIIAYTAYPLSVLSLLYILSRAGYFANGMHDIDIWISARFLELFFAALAFLTLINKKQSGRQRTFRYLYILFTTISTIYILYYLSYSAIYGTNTADNTFKITYVLISAVFLITSAKAAYNTSKILIICFVLKITGDLIGLYSYTDTGLLLYASGILRICAYYILYKITAEISIKKQPFGLMSFKDYYFKVFQHIRMGIIMLNISEDYKSAVIKDINRYAKKYLDLNESDVFGKERNISDFRGTLHIAAKSAIESLKREKSMTRIIKTAINNRSRYIKTRYFPCHERVICIMFEDITQSMEKEKKINELIRYDHLTKIYNRNFTPELEKMLESKTVYPVSVIVGDVNGLKATNDIFGHFEGDRLLKEVASILMNTIDPGDVCMRYGGDEFLIVSFNCDKDKAVGLIAFLNLRLSESKALDFPLSVSFGYSIMESKQELDDHIEKADRMMYERKNEDEMNTRKNILESLLTNFKFQKIESSEHLENVERICLMIGKRMGLSETELGELSLIASLHDIGKINVALDVLKKQGSLTDEEWEMVKKHSSDGYNMTDAIKEFKAISKYILFHHEQWDGKGYPYGLKGEAIPALSRIVALADAYDSMTRERPYKKKLDKQKALWEIKSNSGRQFDPSIVDLLLEMKNIL